MLSYLSFIYVKILKNQKTNKQGLKGFLNTYINLFKVNDYKNSTVKIFMTEN